jgi:hypothetical protein
VSGLCTPPNKKIRNFRTPHNKMATELQPPMRNKSTELYRYWKFKRQSGHKKNSKRQNTNKKNKINK